MCQTFGLFYFSFAFIGMPLSLTLLATNGHWVQSKNVDWVRARLRVAGNNCLNFYNLSNIFGLGSHDHHGSQTCSVLGKKWLGTFVFSEQCIHVEEGKLPKTIMHASIDRGEKERPVLLPQGK